MQSVDHRTWPPFIFIGLSFLLILVFLLVGRSVDAPVDSRASIGDEYTAPSISEYRVSVKEILVAYDESDDAAQAYEELLHLTIPSVEREAHLELVFAFRDLREGNTSAGLARLDLYRAQATWIND